MRGFANHSALLGRALFLLTAALLAASSKAEEPPRLAPEAFFGRPRLTEPSLSPSGDKLALLIREGRDKTALLMLDLRNRGQAKTIAKFADGDIVNLHWINDTRLIFSVANVESDWLHGLQRMPGLYAVNADGSALLQLVRRNRSQLADEDHARQREIGPMISGHVRLVRIPTARDGEDNESVLLAYQSDEGGLSPFWLNTRTRQASPDDFGLQAPASQLFTDSQGQPRLAIVKQGARSQVMRRQSERDWVPLLPARVGDTLPMIVGIDGQGMIYATHTVGEGQHAVLAKLQFKGDSYELANVAEVPGFDFEGTVITNTGSGETEGLRILHAREATVWKGQDMRAFQAAVDQQLPGRVNRIDCRRCGTKDMVALVHSYSDHDPGRLRIYLAGAERPEDRWLDVGPTYTDLEPARMSSVSFQRIKARDGRDLPVWVTRPDQATAPLPAVVLVHGGPWIRGGHWMWKPLQQFLASRGYLVIEPEMRGSLGYGLAHHEAGFKQYGQAMQDDVADALLWARQAGLASERACIAGASYGGYSALMGPVKHPDLYQCAVAQIALADLNLYLEGSFWVRDDIPDFVRERGMAKMVGDPKKDAAMIEANSPVKLADRIKVPVLLAYGEADKRIPLAHGKRMRDALKKAGNAPEWVSYEGEGHGGWSQATQLDYVRRLEAFLAKHLAPR